MKDTPQYVAKVSEMNNDKIVLLDKNVQVPNIGQEQNVGMVSYGLSI